MCIFGGGRAPAPPPPLPPAPEPPPPPKPIPEPEVKPINPMVKEAQTKLGSKNKKGDSGDLRIKRPTAASTGQKKTLNPGTSNPTGGIQP